MLWGRIAAHFDVSLPYLWGYDDAPCSPIEDKHPPCMCPKTQDDNHLGIRIKILRFRLGLTLEEFSNLFTGIPPSPEYISRWESGEQSPPPWMLDRLLEINECVRTGGHISHVDDLCCLAATLSNEDILWLTAEAEYLHKKADNEVTDEDDLRKVIRLIYKLPDSSVRAMRTAIANLDEIRRGR